MFEGESRTRISAAVGGSCRCEPNGDVAVDLDGLVSGLKTAGYALTKIDEPQSAGGTVQSTLGGGDASEATIEALAQWLHEEVEWPDPDFPDRHWPEHPDDTGQRGDGWRKIVPTDTQEQFREIARRLARRFAFAAPAGGTGAEVDANLAALLRYTGEFYAAAMQHGVPAGTAADAVAHVEKAARRLHALASRALPEERTESADFPRSRYKIARAVQRACHAEAKGDVTVNVTELMSGLAAAGFAVVNAEARRPAADDAIETAARALAVSRGLNPDCLHQHQAGDDWPTDHVDQRGWLYHYGWRIQVPHAKAVLAATGASPEATRLPAQEAARTSQSTR